MNCIPNCACNSKLIVTKPGHQCQEGEGFTLGLQWHKYFKRLYSATLGMIPWFGFVFSLYSPFPPEQQTAGVCWVGVLSGEEGRRSRVVGRGAPAGSHSNTRELKNAMCLWSHTAFLCSSNLLTPLHMFLKYVKISPNHGPFHFLWPFLCLPVTLLRLREKQKEPREISHTEAAAPVAIAFFP